MGTNVPDPHHAGDDLRDPVPAGPDDEAEALAADETAAALQPELASGPGASPEAELKRPAGNGQRATARRADDVLWLGAESPTGGLRPVSGRAERGLAVTGFELPSELADRASELGVPLVVMELDSERAMAVVEDPARLRAATDLVADGGALRLVGRGPEQTSLLSRLLLDWPAGWTLEDIGAERGAVSATMRRGDADAVIDQASAAQLLWAGLDRLARSLHERDEQVAATAHRLALRHSQLEQAVIREQESVERDHAMLDEITQLRALVKLERRRLDLLRLRWMRRPVRLVRRVVRKARRLLAQAAPRASG